METLLIALLAVIATAAVVAAVAVTRRRPEAPPVADPLGDVRERLGEMSVLLGQLDRGQRSVEDGQRQVESTIRVLVHNPGKRGSWGELTLLRLLEGAGMKAGDDFEVQRTLPDGSRPDVIIHLGDAGEIVIDAKVPVGDLQLAWESDDPTERAAGLRAFADKVRLAASDLRRRNYPAQLKTSFAPVVMYIPVDGAWQAAREARPDILSELLGMGIHPAEPSTAGMLIALLKHQALTINQEAAVKAVLSDARSLVDRLRCHVDHLGKVGTGLETAMKAYNASIASYEKNLRPAAQRMAEHLNAPVATPDEVRTMPDVERVERILGKMDAA